jgi:hypothetical protein
MPDLRLKLAVFIDFDNIEIGVKNTLNAQFDIGVVLEALKERGDVVSKTAYGDWTRAGDYSRSLTQHATTLVQRNGGSFPHKAPPFRLRSDSANAVEGWAQSHAECDRV